MILPDPTVYSHNVSPAPTDIKQDNVRLREKSNTMDFSCLIKTNYNKITKII